MYKGLAWSYPQELWTPLPLYILGMNHTREWRHFANTDARLCLTRKLFLFISVLRTRNIPFQTNHP